MKPKRTEQKDKIMVGAAAGYVVLRYLQ